jgi:hypothetical protein
LIIDHRRKLRKLSRGAEKTDHHLICHFSFACRAAALAKAGHSMFDVCFLALALRRFLLSLPASML